MTKDQVLYNFWSGFQLPAYDENFVPEAASMPRITYETGTDSFGTEVALTASLWYYSTSWKDISDKAQEIADSIGRGGKIIGTEGGAVWIKRGTPFAQRFGDSNDALRRIVLNITVEFFTED